MDGATGELSNVQGDVAADCGPAALSYRFVLHANVESFPTNFFELDDSSIIVSDGVGGWARRVWLDGSQPTQLLPANTKGASAVLAVDTGYLIVDYNENWVARTGSVAWRNERISRPFAAVVIGQVALVSCCGYENDDVSQLVRLDMQTGHAIGAIGKGAMAYPTGIGIGPDGTILVADAVAGVIQVMIMTIIFCCSSAPVFRRGYFVAPILNRS